MKPMIMLMLVVSNFTLYASEPESHQEDIKILADACYAPPMAYGGACYSSQSIIGSNETFVSYSARITSGNTSVQCQALGCGYNQNDSCRFGWYDIGNMNRGSIRLYWGNNAGSPAIKCKGIPLGTTMEWSWD